MKETNFLVILILWKRNVQENSTLSHSISDALEPVIKMLLRFESDDSSIERIIFKYYSFTRRL